MGRAGCRLNPTEEATSGRLSARFGGPVLRPQGAEAALHGLRSRLSMPDEDAAIAPLGYSGRADEGDATLLAGRFHENQLQLVRLTMTRAGGEHGGRR